MREFISLIWGIGVCILLFVISADFVDSYYNARVARGGDPAFGDIGFTWLFAIIIIGLFTFGLGLIGLLPGTRLKKTSSPHGN